MKQCAKCGETKPITEFNKHSGMKDGLQKHCNACRKEYRVENREKLREYYAKYQADNRDKLRESRARYYAENSDKHKKRMSAWRAENKDKTRAAEAAWRIANPDKVRAYSANYYAANREKHRARVESWNAENKEALRIHNQNSRARKRESGGKLSPGLAEKLFKLQKGKCACCGKTLDDYELDHIIPLALGGMNEDSNMQLLRKTCNRQKHAKHPIDFMQQRGFLL